MIIKPDARITGREQGWRGKRALLFICAGALCLGAAFLAVAILLASCSASVSSAIRGDGGARISVQAEIPPALAAKFRKLAGAGSPKDARAGALFDAAAIRKAIAARPELRLIEMAQPSPDSIHVEISARSLEELATSPDLKNSGLITITHGQGWEEFRFRLARGGAKAISALFPGLDPALTEALSPPALEEDPVTAAEYRTMLKSVLGEKAMPALDAASMTLAVSAPGAVVDSGGGSLAGSTLTATIPIIQVLALDKPIELWLRWKQ